MIWFRVPTFLAGRLHGDHVATEAEAYIDLLGRWAQGEDVTMNSFAAALKWSKGRTMRLMPKVAEWAIESGADLPDRWRADRTSDRKRTAHRTAPELDEPTLSDSDGPETDRTSDRKRTASRTRDPFSEREVDETRGKENTPLPPTPDGAGPPPAAPESSAFQNGNSLPTTDPSPAPPPQLIAADVPRSSDGGGTNAAVVGTPPASPVHAPLEPHSVGTRRTVAASAPQPGDAPLTPGGRDGLPDRRMAAGQAVADTPTPPRSDHGRDDPPRRTDDGPPLRPARPHPESEGAGVERGLHGGLPGLRADGAVPADPEPLRAAQPAVPTEPALTPRQATTISEATATTPAPLLVDSTGKGGAETGQRLTADEMLVWECWRIGYHKRAALTPGPALKHIRAGLRRLGPERTVRLIQWAHEAPHDRAGFLRGPGYDLGKTGAYLALSNLLVADNLDQRDAWAEEWEQAGRPHYARVLAFIPHQRPGKPTMMDLVRAAEAREANPPPTRIILEAK